MDLNKNQYIGRLTRDPELKFIPGSGTAVATIPLAVESRYKQGEETKKEVLFIDCIAFSRQAENAAQYLQKGSKDYVEGRLRIRQWEHEGQKKSKPEVLISNNGIIYLSHANNNGNGGQSPKELPDDIPEEITDIDPF